MASVPAATAPSPPAPLPLPVPHPSSPRPAQPTASAPDHLATEKTQANDGNASKPPSTRFTLELEFVLCLSNPYYLSHLATTYPHLLNPRTSNTTNQETPAKTKANKDEDNDNENTNHPAAKFARYLAYLYDYWRRPEYARFLTHPGATLRNLELLQHEQFRKDIIRPDVIHNLLLSSADPSSTTAVDKEPTSALGDRQQGVDGPGPAIEAKDCEDAPIKTETEDGGGVADAVSQQPPPPPQQQQQDIEMEVPPPAPQPPENLAPPSPSVPAIKIGPAPDPDTAVQPQ